MSVLATLNLNNPALQAPLTAQQNATLVAAVQQVLSGVPGVQNVSLANAQVGLGAAVAGALGWTSPRLGSCQAVNMCKVLPRILLCSITHPCSPSRSGLGC